MVRGIGTSEFYVTILAFVVGMVGKWAGADFPTEAFIVVGSYIISRGLAKFNRVD